MINDLNVNINNYIEKIINNYPIFLYVCPKCGAKHSFIRYGYYQRYVCFFNEKFDICELRCTILRLRCKSCLSTHAVLPANIIPYKIYDRPLILHILTLHFVFEKSVLTISQKYNISYQQLYKFIEIFKSFLNSLYFVLRVVLGFTDDILNIHGMIEGMNKHFTDFSYQYYNNTKWIFLMTKFKDILPRPIYVGVYYKPPTQPVNS